MKKHKTIHDFAWDRIADAFQAGLVAADLKANAIDATDKTAAAAFLTDERRHHPAAIAVALATASTK